MDDNVIPHEELKLGFVKMWRCLLNSSLMKRPNLCHFWVYCLLKAQFRETNTAKNYHSVALKPGQLIFGRKSASKETGLSERNIRTCIKRLTSENRIKMTTVSTRQFSIITILNWDAYQNNQTNNGQPSDHPHDQPTTNPLTNERPTSDQRLPNQRPHLKNDKNVNKDKKEKNVENEKKREENMLLLKTASTPSPTSDKSKQEKKTFLKESDEYLLVTFLKESICKNKPDFRFPKDWQDWARTFDLMLRIDKRDPQRIIEVVEWAQANSFWQTNILSARSLRKQFDQLEMKMAPKTENSSGMPRKPGDVSNDTQPNNEVLKLVIKRYKTAFFCDPANISEESYNKLVKAAVRAEEFSAKTKINVKEVVKYLIKCLDHNYTNEGRAVLPGHLCSDNTWYHLMPQYLSFLPYFAS